MLLSAFYVLYLALAPLLAWRLFALLRARGRVVALLGASMALVVTALFLPIPIHGGFTFALQIAVEELQRKEWQQEQRQAEQRRDAFQQGLAQRFAAPLLPELDDEGSDGWRAGVLKNGEAVWLDEQSGLLWRAPQEIATAASRLSEAQAKDFCREQFPLGHWALPTEAELALLWQHHGQSLMPGSGQSSAALLADDTLQLELVTQFRGALPGYALRCVAITDAAPDRGYTGSDIPLELWNRFQLSKSELYTLPASPPQEMK